MHSWLTHKQNSVLVYVRMYAVTERGVIGLQADVLNSLEFSGVPVKFQDH